MVEKIRKALDLARAERSRLGTDEDGLRLRRDDPAADATRDRTVGVAELSAGDSPRTRAAPLVARARHFTPDPAVLERNQVLGQHSVSAAAEAFRLLRTQLLQRMAEQRWRTVAVVSPSVDPRRVVVATNLAAAIAADSRHHALLVDVNLRTPRVATLFGLEPETGVESVLAGECPIDACLYRPEGFDRLVLAPARTPMARASELLAGEQTGRFVAELRDRYPDRYVVYDVPPALESDEALAFLPVVDCVLLVVREAYTRRDEVARTMQLLRRIPVVGSVLGDSAGAGRSIE